MKIHFQTEEEISYFPLKSNRGILRVFFRLQI